MKLSIALLLVGVLSCGVADATSMDFYTINFKSGMPSEYEGYEESLNASWDTYSRLLGVDASLLISLHSKYRFKVVGFTDNKECQGSDCTALSLRRATMVQKWLLANGVPADELDPPEGLGAVTPLDSNDTVNGRLRNRRVEIHFILQ